MIFLFILAVLATMRLTVLVITEDGPFGIVLRLRSFVHDRAMPRPGFWRNVWHGITCPYCVSFWLALLCTGIVSYYFRLSWVYWVLMWWGGAGATAVLLLGWFGFVKGAE